MKIRAKSPLRLGIAGGGTDVSPYSDTYSGAVLNATINLYTHVYLETTEANTITFNARDIGQEETLICGKSRLMYSSGLSLHRAVYQRIMDQFNNGNQIPINLTTYSDAPPGSGLGSSSSLVVCMIEAYRELLSLPLGEYDVAKLAFEIERIDCGFAGGKQDQYAAAFGGFNFIEFAPENVVIVNPLRIKRSIIHELQSSTILFYTGASRSSAKIIEDQVNTLKNGGSSLQAMHEIKNSAFELKAALLKGSIFDLAFDLRKSWEAKKATSKSITNERLDKLEKLIMSAGAISMKVSGAGGGGFVMIFTAPEKKYDVIDALNTVEGEVINFEFTLEGVVSWRA